MIITKSKPFIKDEIEKLKEQFDVYVKLLSTLKREYVLRVPIGILNQKRFY